MLKVGEIVLTGVNWKVRRLVPATMAVIAIDRGRSYGYHLWTPPFRQGKTLGSLLRVVGCCHLSGL